MSQLERGYMLMRGGDLARAEPLLRRAVQNDPANHRAAHWLSYCLMGLGRMDQALYFAEQAAAHPQADAAMFDVLGTLYAQRGERPKALEAFRRAVRLNPNLATVQNGLGLVASQMDYPGHLDEALGAMKKALAMEPENAGFAANYLVALGQGWQVTEQLDFARAQAARHPQDIPLRMALAGLLNYFEAPDEAMREHIALAGLIEHAAARARTAEKTALGPAPLAAADVRDCDGDPARLARPLRIGLVSADFRTHSVASFIEPLLREAARDGSGAEMFCYAEVDRPDEVTARFKALAGPTHWREITRLPDRAAVELIRKDRLDVAVDLGAYTAASRIELFARGLAPLHASYCGYPNTTGLKNMDLRLVDSWTDPPGSETRATERLLRLDPCFLCYQGRDDVPPAASHEGSRGGAITFGSFNLLTKVGPETVEMWSRVLARVGGSRLLLKAKALKHESVRARVLAEFTSRGIAPDRLELIGWQDSTAEHLALYARMDIGLDPYPYHGTTTTCEAMWMGVPVVTRAGTTHASRVGVSLLTNVGLADLVATSADEYVDIAARLAADAPRRQGLRSDGPESLRARMKASPLCDAASMTRRFVDALRIESVRAAIAAPRP